MTGFAWKSGGTEQAIGESFHRRHAPKEVLSIQKLISREHGFCRAQSTIRTAPKPGKHRFRAQAVQKMQRDDGPRAHSRAEDGMRVLRCGRSNGRPWLAPGGIGRG
jgi:hypothetical protein